jgi:3-hydroxybutyryl-CoA dehydrogenase
MGAGIAQVCAQAGWKTNLFDAFPDGLERGMARIDAFWDKGIARGKTTPEQKAEWAARLHAVGDMAEAVGKADMVIEAVPEIPDLKHSIFADLDRLAPAHAILGTNTSSLSIADIAAATSRPEQVIGMHFFNPVPIMKLLELVRHDSTSDATVAAAEAAGIAMAKTTILVKDVPGFATSRLGVVLGNEAIRMLADGVASAEDIDTAMVLGYKHPMGPLKLTDLVGLDVRRDILLNLQRSFNDDRYAPHPLLEEMVAKGHLGQKSGQGFFEW